MHGHQQTSSTSRGPMHDAGLHHAHHTHRPPHSTHTATTHCAGPSCPSRRCGARGGSARRPGPARRECAWCVVVAAMCVCGAFVGPHAERMPGLPTLRTCCCCCCCCVKSRTSAQAGTPPAPRTARSPPKRRGGGAKAAARHAPCCAAPAVGTGCRPGLRLMWRTLPGQTGGAQERAQPHCPLPHRLLLQRPPSEGQGERA